MINSVKKNLEDHHVRPSSGILLGVSGGVDSMVLLAVLKKLGFLCTAAHVNFQLRAEESDRDANLVRDWCYDHKIPFLEYVADTSSYAASHKLNTQSAAREIRYNWWHNLMQTGNYEFVATAHHQDDSVETFFLNLMRGSGLKGLRGIPAQRDYFIRPLINISKSAIESFAHEHEVPFRTDRSNESDDYQRNRIRHHLIPLLRDLNPHIDSVMQHVIFRLDAEWKSWEFAYQEWQQKNVKEVSGGFEVRALKPEEAFLLKWLEEKEFPWLLTHDFINSQQADKGKVLEFKDHILSRIKDGYFLEKISNPPSLIIFGPGNIQYEEGELSIEPVSHQDLSFHADAWIEYADLENVTWPLELRPVLPGDHFQPFGMMGQTKKIQDFLVNLKLNYHEKNKVRLLTSSHHILWIIGLRLDERIRVKPDSKKIFRLHYRKI